MKPHKRVALFVLGTIPILAGLYIFFTTIVFRSELVRISGTLQSCKIEVNRHDAKRHVSELSIYIKGILKKFTIRDGIGRDYESYDHIEMQRKLEQAGFVRVSIKANEYKEYFPEVFEVSTDETTLLDFDEVIEKRRTNALYTFVLGLGIVILAYFSKTK